ncbi:hypothetical protein PG993_013193 [Apiospora rasikravindrae]|uniref:CmcJ-like methyltransferase n=1 Tax=Apiospora rasikravindrae TaxID=990691 RepID=A0ABR1RWZ2_9PEZI
MQSSLYYIEKTANLKQEKAFSTDFTVDHVEGAVDQNATPDCRQVTVNAIQDPDDFQLDVHGFCVLHGQTHLDHEGVYRNKASVQDAYYYEIEAILHEAFPQYSRIEAFDLTACTPLPHPTFSSKLTYLQVRKRDVDFPDVVRGYRKEYEQPSSIAHCDWSKNGSLKVLHWCFPGNESYWEGKRFDMLNVWRPLKQPSDDWPLAVCDYTTVDPDHDIRLSDAIRRDRVDEVCVLHYNEKHKWYYLKDQGVEDLLVFRNADSHGERARAFHAAVHNPQAQGPPRESVEVRLVAIY